MSLPWVRDETNVDAVNHWTKIIRNHTIKFGADVRRIHDNLLQDQTYGASGAIDFTRETRPATGHDHACTDPLASGGVSTASTPTNIGNEMASFLLDQP